MLTSNLSSAKHKQFYISCYHSTKYTSSTQPLQDSSEISLSGLQDDSFLKTRGFIHSCLKVSLKKLLSLLGTANKFGRSRGISYCMPEHEVFGKKSRLVSPTERTAGIKSSVLIFFCSTNDSAFSGRLGSVLWSSELLTTPTSSKETGGKSKSIERWEKKPNNWGTLGRDENGNI